DFIGPFRGQTPGEVAPNSYVQGYEDMKMWFGNIGILKIWGADVLPGADQFGFLLEFNSIYLPDFPDYDELQFEAPGTFTHASPGIVETNNGLKLNPFRQPEDNFVTDFSLGYRLGLLAVYNNVWKPGLSLRPLLVLVHDVEGIAPGLAEIILEGRKIILSNLEAKYDDWSLNLQYGVFTGAGKQNTLRDRDVFAVALSYDF
ncbi:MAG: DUF1302 family protein, partial [Salinisphaeraceae bacterium]|nr:DUF1302 family protein [Salinisphaeraceae bacterium]